MAYKFDDVDYQDMDDLALSEHQERNEWDNIESNKNKSDDYSMDALDIYDSPYE